MLDKSLQEFLNNKREQEIRYLNRVLGTEFYRRCPLESQGELVSAAIIETAEKIFYCDECDAIWKAEDPIDEIHATNFQTFLLVSGKRGLTGDDLQID